jgi:two-component system, LytTR family, sensor kinase
MIQDIRKLKIRVNLEPFLHVLVWSSLILFVWHTVNTIGPFRKQDGSIYFPLIWSIGLSMLLFYLNGLYLIPLYVNTRLFKKYTFWAILLFVTIVLLNSIFDQLYSLSLFSSEKESFLSDLLMNTQSKTVILSLSIGYGLTRQWFKNQEHQQKLIQDDLKTQLKYLKAQINPHFLFNTLNMAYASATKSNDVVTADIVEKLSGLMRYVLYESNEEKVFLEKEIHYIDNTVNLQLQRLSPELAGQVNYQVEGDWQSHKIAPMILIPFIENVFKHGIVLSQRSDITISIFLRDNILTLETRNAKSDSVIKKDTISGIGLKNARERLLLIYPGKHKLEIDDSCSSFHVKLQIEIN